MKLLILLFILPITQLLHAQVPQFEWAKQIGNNGQDVSNAIIVDGSGNVYTTGLFNGTVDFDPGIGIHNLTAPASKSNVFILKLDAAGNYVWAKQFIVDGGGQGTAITVDASGNIFAAGIFSGAINFDPGGSNFNFSTIARSSFISKLDASGNFIWAKQFGLGFQTGQISVDILSLAIDNNGNIYTTGQFFGTVDFDPGQGIFNLTTVSSNLSEIFVLKLDAIGNFIWAKQMEGIISITEGGTISMGRSLVLDSSGNVYVTGYFGNRVDFDPGPGIFYFYTTYLKSNAFILKLDPGGNFVWAKQLGRITNSNLTGMSMALDAAGNIYTTGSFSDTVDFDPGPGVFTLNTASRDAYICKIDANGNFVWASKIAIDRNSHFFTRSIATDIMGDIYITGSLNGVLFSGHIFIAKCDRFGNLIWVEPLMNGQPSTGLSIVVDQAGSIYTTGYFEQTVDFDPGTDNYYLTSGGYEDIFIHKMGQCINTSSSILNKSACYTYTLNNQTYTASGTYTQILSNSHGCDSTITLNLTITGSSSSTFAATACHSYYWNGTTFISSGIYKDTLISVKGCDSIIVLNLTINNSFNSVYNVEACKSYSRNGKTYFTSGTYTDSLTSIHGCDSIVTLQLIIDSIYLFTTNQSICQGQSYAGHSVSGTYTDTIIVANGCDSIKTLHLNVKPKSYSVINAEICLGENYSGYTQPGTYTETIAAANGCDSVRAINLIVKNNCIPIGIPNAFTPNKDGWNDTFKPLIKQTVQQYHMEIYNRYGQKLFESNNYLTGWDGNFNGKAQENGTYIYHVNFKNSLGILDDRKGAFILLR